MSTSHVSNSRNSTLIIDGSGDRWIVDAGVRISDPDAAIHLENTASNNRVDIRGLLKCDEDTLFDEGTGTTITIAGSGRLVGDDGIFSLHGARITNAGLIDMLGNGVSFYDQGTLINSGTIKSGDNTISLADGTIDNRTGGTIRSGDTAISSLSLSADVIHITNDGLIVGKQAAINGLIGREIVVNRGAIHGKIELGDGNDSVDTRLGTVDHDIAGGKGNDTLWTSNGTVRLLESFGEGSDTVRSTVSYTLNAEVETLVLLGDGNTTAKGNAGINTLTGNQGDNRLLGLGNNDWLDGKGGDDRLTGGLGDQDIFIFSTGYDHDTITDFEDGTDRIDLQELSAIADYADLLANHTSDTDAGLLIFAGKDRLIVTGMTESKLDSAEVYI